MFLKLLFVVIKVILLYLTNPLSRQITFSSESQTNKCLTQETRGTALCDRLSCWDGTRRSVTFNLVSRGSYFTFTCQVRSYSLLWWTWIPLRASQELRVWFDGIRVVCDGCFLKLPHDSFSELLFRKNNRPRFNSGTLKWGSVIKVLSCYSLTQFYSYTRKI